nr:hypothetical protein [Enterococcus faecalis]
MSITKNIKCTDEKTSHSIKQILNIKDSHITFSKDAISKERVHGRMANVFTGWFCCKVLNLLSNKVE